MQKTGYLYAIAMQGTQAVSAYSSLRDGNSTDSYKYVASQYKPKLDAVHTRLTNMLKDASQTNFAKYVQVNTQSFMA